MNIALEVGLNAEGKRGVDAYLHGIIHGLAEADPANHYKLFTYFFTGFDRKRLELPLPDKANFELCVRRWPQRIAETLEWRWGLPLTDVLFARSEGINLYHGLTGRVPRLRDAKTVVTVYDLIPELFLRPTPSGNRAPELVTGVAARRADHVITISKSTRDDLIRIYGIEPSKVTPIHCAVDHGLFRPAGESDSEAIRAKYRLDGPFLLTTGPFETRRNAGRILEAVSRLRKEGIAPKCLLVFVGKRNPYFETLEAQARALGLAEDIRCLGYVPQKDLPALYSLCLGFVYPSLYEGFGLSVLEAMACGAPVVTSKVSSMPEVAGEAAILVDPESPGEIAAALRDVVSRPHLRADMRAKGLKQAQKFTWRRAAEETLSVYRKVTGRP